MLDEDFLILLNLCLTLYCKKKCFVIRNIDFVSSINLTFIYSVYYYLLIIILRNLW